MLRLASASQKRRSHPGTAFFFAGSNPGRGPVSPVALIAALPPAAGRWVLLCAAALLSGCSPAGQGDTGCGGAEGLPRFQVDRVVDGDTVNLRGGERVRLIGINTPELGRDGRPPEPLAEDATEALRQMIGSAGVYLQEGLDARDRHGRRLAHLFSSGGDNLQAGLLRRGLAYHVAVAPNFAHVECLAAAERQARKAGLGLWRGDAGLVAVADLARDQRGFVLLRDRVTRVSFKENGWWVQLGGKVGLHIDQRDQHRFRRAQLSALDGRRVEARGWLVPMGGWWQIKLYHPAMLQPAAPPGRG